MGSQILSNHLPPVADIKRDLEGVTEIRVSEFLEKYGVDPGRVIVMKRGKPLSLFQTFNPQEKDWLVMSQTIGG